MKIDSLDLALIEFQAAQVAARVCDCSTEEPAKYIKQVIDGIKKQRDEAIKQKKIAQQERKKTESALASLYVNHAGDLMNKEDIRPAWRLVEKALAKDKNNAEARKLSALIPEYASRYFLDGIGDEVVVRAIQIIAIFLPKKQMAIQPLIFLTCTEINCCIVFIMLISTIITEARQVKNIVTSAPTAVICSFLHQIQAAATF